MLHIISSGNNDTGNYTCEASNLLGFAEGKIQLIVEGERKIKAFEAKPGQFLSLRIGCSLIDSVKENPRYLE